MTIHGRSQEQNYGRKPRTGRGSRGPARDMRERCKLTQQGSGQSPDIKCISDTLRALKTRLQILDSIQFLELWQS